MDVWGQLWEIALGDAASGSAHIEIDPEDPGEVTLTWPDGSRGAWYFDDGEWKPREAIDAAPCDVAARDAF